VNLLFVVVGNTFVAVQRLLVLGADLVDETIYVVPGGRDDIGIATMVYHPTPLGEDSNPNVLVIGAAAVHLVYPHVTPVTKVDGSFVGLDIIGHVRGVRTLGGPGVTLKVVGILNPTPR